MDIILLKDVEKLGYKHDVVTVKNGFGRNYLIPQGLAVIANTANKKKLDGILAEIDAKEAAKVDDYKALAEKLEGQVIKIGVKAGTSGKIFGSVTNLQVSNALQEQMEAEVERKKIHVPDIKEVGEYDVVIALYEDIVANIKINLTAE